MHKNPLKLYAILLILTLSGRLGHGQNSSIIVDELFNDWSLNMASYTDGRDNQNGIDLIDMQVSHDDRYLYIKLTLDRELCLGNDLVDHEIWLHIDTDHDPSTGFPEQDGYGTEIAININGHYAWFNTPDPNARVTLGDIEFQVAPTFTSSIFEIALPREVKPDGINELFLGDTISIAFNDDKDNDRMPNNGIVFSYAFQPTTTTSASPISIEKTSPADIRVVSYNILFNNGFSPSAIDAMQRVVLALEGDIYCFQECSEDTANVRRLFNSWLPLPNGKSWDVGKGSGRVTVSRWPITEDWDLNRKTAHSIDVPDSISRRDMLLVNGHLSCCTNNAGRQDQADEFASFILDAKRPGGTVSVQDSTPIVFVGDMNLVGFSQQYRTILTGDIQNTALYGNRGLLDWDNTDLTDARPLHVDSNFVYTWRDLQGDGFPPGRLDFQFFSDAVLAKEHAFILDTERMDAAMLLANNLQQNDTRVIADHLPVVVDYSLKENTLTSTNELNGHRPSLQVYPNPAKDVIYIDTDVEIEQVIVRDLLGHKVAQSASLEGKVSLPELPRGIYMLQIKLRDYPWQHVKVMVGMEK
ncbi:MAG: T9SS type A sorting domain-containing protein [Bacteroidota bacterium]